MPKKRIHRLGVAAVALAATAALFCQAASSARTDQLTGQPAFAQQPKIASHHAPILSQFGLKFRDLNRNGQIDGYEDWRLPVDLRVADLVSRMTLEEKVGLMLHPSVEGFIGPDGAVLDRAASGGRAGANPQVETLRFRPSPRDLVLERNIRWMQTPVSDKPEIAARWADNLQDLAEGSRLGIPVVLSSQRRDFPRRSDRSGSTWPSATSAAPLGAGSASAGVPNWPDPIAFGAIGDPEAVRQYGQITNREYRAMGIRVIWGPQADVGTEPRWNGISGTFGEDAKLDAQMVKAYIEGFQGDTLGPGSVMTVTKYWPGQGAMKEGLDPHFEYGKLEVYPGRNFGYQVLPFRAAFEAHTGGVMPGSAIPVGMDSVGMNFSKKILGDLLRVKYGYDGMVMAESSGGAPWGVEDLSPAEQIHRMVDAGVDQIGGEDDPRVILALAQNGAISQERLNASVARILRPMFELGLFENPYVDPAQAIPAAAQSEAVEAAEAAQRKSIVLLKNDKALLPLPGQRKIYVEGMRKDAAGKYGTVVGDPKDADIAIVEVSAPYALHPGAEGAERLVHEGTLAYAGAENASSLEAIQRVAGFGKPTIVCIYMDRPAILSEFIDNVAAVLAHFGSRDEALLDIIFGRYAATGKSPFDIPRDMTSVRRHREDTPHDTENPLFRFGFGLSFEAVEEKPPKGPHGNK
jgi:beta-glucosidase